MNWEYLMEPELWTSLRVKPGTYESLGAVPLALRGGVFLKMGLLADRSTLPEVTAVSLCLTHPLGRLKEK